MKRWGKILLCALALFGVLLAGCGEGPTEKKEAGGVFAFCGGELQDFAETFDENEIAYMEYGHTIDTPISCRITDKGTIRAVFDALREVRIGERNDTRATDSEQSLTFVKEDGTSYVIRFEQHYLWYGKNAYRLENDEALWKVLSEAK